ncbi:MAG: hypothetical protein GXP55_23735, partial [Deltaproteobacteria bacterium]|nr:hypothetical protein [Deltaproteobacteria bacterium]
MTWTDTRVPKRTIAIVILTLMALVAASPERASAQAELTGTYIDYLGVGANGIMINAANHSMRYSESGAAPYSCDIWFPGQPVHQFTITATATAGTTSATNTPGATGIPTSTPTTTTGRRIRWEGIQRFGGVQLRVRSVYDFTNVADRWVRQTITITNLDATREVTDLYVLVNGDPDHGRCDIGTSYASTNDVLRQEPADGSALVTAIAGDPTTRVAFGLGAFNPIARAHVNTSGLPNTNAVATWATPNDPNGTTADVGVGLVFRARRLAAGASRAFRMAYVWGPDQASVATRFDALQCELAAAGSSCTDAGGAAGTCRAGACCTGCWDGAACQAGATTGACGAAGAVCATCDDGNACTDD